MPSSGMWRRVDLLRTDVWEESAVSVFGVERISELGAASTVTSTLLVTVTVCQLLIMLFLARRLFPP
jgi:hypothetical protein